MAFTNELLEKSAQSAMSTLRIARTMWWFPLNILIEYGTYD